MKRIPLFVLLSILVSACLFVCPAAYAQGDCGEHCIQNPEDGFNGWESLEPSGYNPPTMNRCTANGAVNQACHVCDQKQNPNGTWTLFCGWTQHSAACSCNYPTS